MKIFSRKKINYIKIKKMSMLLIYYNAEAMTLLTSSYYYFTIKVTIVSQKSL